MCAVHIQRFKRHFFKRQFRNPGIRSCILISILRHTIYVNISSPQFYENGIAVVENFFSEAEVNELKDTALSLCKNAPEDNKCVFGKYEADEYYLDSGNKIAYFYDASALDADGNLLVPKERAISRVSVNQNRTKFLSRSSFNSSITYDSLLIAYT